MTAPVVGIIGGGQLARMTHQAAVSLGVRIVVLCPDDDAPALLAGAGHLSGRPDSFDDVVALAERVDVVTIEHELTPAEFLDRLVALGHRVAPGGSVARLGQDKAVARSVLGPLGVPVAPWLLSADPVAIDAFAADHGWPIVLKAPSGGYDGRGVWTAADPDEVGAVIAAAQRPLLVEPLLAFSHELAVMVVRSSGDSDQGRAPEVVAYPPFETIQLNGQCSEAFTPATVPDEVAREARALAVTIAESVGLVGAMAVELFVVDDDSAPGGRRVLLNELAVRPHNSGHLTIEACSTSQFENHLRAVLGWPLGSTELRAGAACMRNVVGPPDGSDPFDHLPRALAVPGAHVHHYAKSSRPSRKLGHITVTAADLDEARAVAGQALAALAAGPGSVAQ